MLKKIIFSFLLSVLIIPIAGAVCSPADFTLSKTFPSNGQSIKPLEGTELDNSFLITMKTEIKSGDSVSWRKIFYLLNNSFKDLWNIPDLDSCDENDENCDYPCAEIANCQDNTWLGDNDSCFTFLEDIKEDIRYKNYFHPFFKFGKIESYSTNFWQYKEVGGKMELQEDCDGSNYTCFGFIKDLVIDRNYSKHQIHFLLEDDSGQTVQKVEFIVLDPQNPFGIKNGTAKYLKDIILDGWNKLIFEGNTVYEFDEFINLSKSVFGPDFTLEMFKEEPGTTILRPSKFFREDRFIQIDLLKKVVIHDLTLDIDPYRTGGLDYGIFISAPQKEIIIYNNKIIAGEKTLVGINENSPIIGGYNDVSDSTEIDFFDHDKEAEKIASENIFIANNIVIGGEVGINVNGGGVNVFNNLVYNSRYAQNDAYQEIRKGNFLGEVNYGIGEFSFGSNFTSLDWLAPQLLAGEYRDYTPYFYSFYPEEHYLVAEILKKLPTKTAGLKYCTQTVINQITGISPVECDTFEKLGMKYIRGEQALKNYLENLKENYLDIRLGQPYFPEEEVVVAVDKKIKNTSKMDFTIKGKEKSNYQLVSDGLASDSNQFLEKLYNDSEETTTFKYCGDSEKAHHNGFNINIDTEVDSKDDLVNIYKWVSGINIEKKECEGQDNLLCNFDKCIEKYLPSNIDMNIDTNAVIEVYDSFVNLIEWGWEKNSFCDAYKNFLNQKIATADLQQEWVAISNPEWWEKTTDCLKTQQYLKDYADSVINDKIGIEISMRKFRNVGIKVRQINNQLAMILGYFEAVVTKASVFTGEASTKSYSECSDINQVSSCKE